MQKDLNSYYSIFKAISLFGGVKVFQIIIGIVKNKFIAVLLGPTGMGIAGMITSTTGFISSLSGFGLETSAVKEVAQAHSSSDEFSVNKVITVLRKLILFTGILGMILTFLFSSYLSVWAFGNEDYSISFKIVSVILLMNQLSIGQTVLLQGTFRYKFMAKASFIGSILGLVITVPLYYFYGFNAIVPAIILASFFNLLLTWFYSLKIPYEPVKLSVRQVFQEGRTMLVLGLTIAITGVINTGQVFFLRLMISRYGSLSDVGLYSAGMTIATSYIGIVLTAMSSDYSPRLASVAHDKNLMIETINKQAILLTTILAPLIIAFIVFIKEVILILYSDQFISISGMIEWIMFGMFFRAISWSISFSFVANNNPGAFLLNTVLSSSYSLVFSVFGYIWFGFQGLGMAFCLTNIIYTLHMMILGNRIFGFQFNSDFLKISIPQILLSGAAFALMKSITSGLLHYGFGLIFIILVSSFAYYHLNKMIDIKALTGALKKKINL